MFNISARTLTLSHWSQDFKAPVSDRNLEHIFRNSKAESQHLHFPPILSPSRANEWHSWSKWMQLTKETERGDVTAIRSKNEGTWVSLTALFHSSLLAGAGLLCFTSLNHFFCSPVPILLRVTFFLGLTSVLVFLGIFLLCIPLTCPLRSCLSCWCYAGWQMLPGEKGNSQ